MPNEFGKSYQDAEVWQRAMDLAESCYRMTRSFPKDELYGMTAQVRRAAVAIPATIAEGKARGTRAEYIQFLRLAHGSLMELETHVVLARRLGVVSVEDALQLLNQCTSFGSQLQGLINSLDQQDET